MQALERYLARRPMPPAVVAGVGGGSGLAAIRQLARAGIPVVALDRHRGALGFRSRYGFGVLAPDPLTDPDGYVDVLVRLADAIGRPVPVLPTQDDHLNAIARAAPVLGRRFLYPFPARDVLERVQSPRHQLERAAELGVPVPRTASEPTDDLGLPVLVRPSDHVRFRRAFGRRSFRCDTRAELDEAWVRALPYEPFVQELLPGGDDALSAVAVYLAPDGEALGLFWGWAGGRTPLDARAAWGEGASAGDVVEPGLALLRGLGVTGLAHAEFKRDPRDGAFKLTAVRPRLWERHGHAAACGVDFPRIAYWDLLGARLAPARANGGSKRRKLALARGTRPALVRPPDVDGVFARDDPRPALAQAARLVRRRGP